MVGKIFFQSHNRERLRITERERENTTENIGFIQLNTDSGTKYRGVNNY